MFFPTAGRSQRVRHRFAHADEHTGGAKLITVMKDVAGVDGGQIGDKQAGMKGAEIDNLSG